MTTTPEMMARRLLVPTKRRFAVLLVLSLWHEAKQHRQANWASLLCRISSTQPTSAEVGEQDQQTKERATKDSQRAQYEREGGKGVLQSEAGPPLSGSGTPGPGHQSRGRCRGVLFAHVLTRKEYLKEQGPGCGPRSALSDPYRCQQWIVVIKTGNAIFQKRLLLFGVGAPVPVSTTGAPPGPGQTAVAGVRTILGDEETTAVSIMDRDGPTPLHVSFVGGAPSAKPSAPHPFVWRAPLLRRSLGSDGFQSVSS